MLEGLLIYLFGRHNRSLVQAKGHQGTSYVWLTVLMWFGGEALGFVVGLVVLGTADGIGPVYVVALVTAAAGACVAWLMAKQVPVNPAALWLPNALTPPEGLPAWIQPDPTVPPSVMLPSSAPVRVEEQRGEWAVVATPNGWRGFVDARRLIPIANPTPIVIPAR